MNQNLNLTIYVKDYANMEKAKEQILFYAGLAQELRKTHHNVVMNIVVGKETEIKL